MLNRRRLTITMELQNDQSIINLKFMKITGSYQLLMLSNSLKLIKINIYKTTYIHHANINACCCYYNGFL